MRKLMAFFMSKINQNKYFTHQQTTTELQAPNLGQAHTYRMWRI